MAHTLTDAVSLRTDPYIAASPKASRARSSSVGTTREAKTYDVCVVGGGPVGIALAMECAAHGLTVALIEAGEDKSDPAASDDSSAHVVEPRRHVPMDIAVRRALGGTSWLWGGRCVPFDAIDFEARDFVPESGWPIGHDEVSPWYAAAARYLDCGEVARLPSPPEMHVSQPLELTEYFAKEPKRALDLRAEIAAHPRIDLMLDSTVTGLFLGAGGRSVEGLIIDGGPRPRAKFYVLACGGLETTRLLLSVQRELPHLFGGQNGSLGRYYAGHFEGTIANVVFDSADEIGRFDYSLGGAGAYQRRVLGISGETQRREKIQNIAFWPDNLPFYDPSHKSGIKSFIYLLAVLPRIGPRLLSEGIRQGIVGEGPRRYLSHVLNMLRAPARTTRDIFDIIRDRFVSKRRKPGWLLATPNSTYVLHYRAEQRPNRDSTVSLFDEVDTHGMPRLRIDLRYTEEDARTALRAHELLDASLRASGRGRLEYVVPEAERMASILDQASDGYHQTGTTRMGDDPANSVVDGDCRVHGFSNLFIASSSVFPTSGHANPTLLATALASRLAQHLQRVTATVEAKAADCVAS